MHKKIFTTILALLPFVVSYCQQENEFVEVVVTDTIQVMPDEIIFSFVLQNDPDYMVDVTPSALGHNKNSKTENRTGKTSGADAKISLIEKIIAAQKIDTLPFIQYTINNEDYTGVALKNWLLRFSGPAQLTAFAKEVAGMKRVFGLIVSKKSAQEHYFNQQLTKKILQKAETDASYIAAQSKKTVGKLLQIKEEELDTVTGGWTSYPPLGALASAMYPGAHNQSMIVITRKLRVRYSWQ